MAKLYDVVAKILQIALEQPSVKSAMEGSVYQLNETKTQIYGAFVATQGQHTLEDGFIRYNFTFFYVDRLTASGDNRLLVQSTGVDTLSNIILRLENEDFGMEGNATINTFTERFESECAGAYATLNILLPVDDCYETY